MNKENLYKWYLKIHMTSGKTLYCYDENKFENSTDMANHYFGKYIKAGERNFEGFKGMDNSSTVLVCVNDMEAYELGIKPFN